jgi:hypothetical protein
VWIRGSSAKKERNIVSRLPDTFEWLSAGIPITLIVDMVEPEGPDSARIIREEPADTGWISAA